MTGQSLTCGSLLAYIWGRMYQVVGVGLSLIQVMRDPTRWPMECIMWSTGFMAMAWFLTTSWWAPGVGIWRSSITKSPPFSLTTLAVLDMFGRVGETRWRLLCWVERRGRVDCGWCWRWLWTWSSRNLVTIILMRGSTASHVVLALGTYVPIRRRVVVKRAPIILMAQSTLTSSA